MAGITPFGMQQMLNYTLATATPTAITSWSVALATSTAPTTASMFEVVTGIGMNRASCTFGAAASPAGSCSNNNVLSYGPSSNAMTVSGVSIWNTGTITGGSPTWFGTLAVARTLAIGDSLLINAGSLLITLA